MLRRVMGAATALLLLSAAAYGLASRGPLGLRGEYRRRIAEVAASASASMPTPVVTEADLRHLPAPVADYVRRSGAIGRPRVTIMRAEMHGRIRSGPDAPWMPFTAEQVNSFAGKWRRLFFMDATMRGLPVDVLHVYDGGRATMRARVCSLIPVVDASGTDMSRAERVTVVNDICVLAPGVLPFADAVWEEVDARHARAVFPIDGEDVHVELSFGEDGDLLDFVSDDRLRADDRGTSFARQRWSTPISRMAEQHGHVLASQGEARWHAPEPEGEFAYLEFMIDTIEYTASPVGPSTRPGLVSRCQLGRDGPTIDHDSSRSTTDSGEVVK
jgi:hypothetical protein